VVTIDAMGCQRDTHETVDADYGRIETLNYIRDVDWLRARHQWPGPSAVVESRREINGKITNETRFYITSLVMLATVVGPTIRALSHREFLARGHGHDLSRRRYRVRTDNAPANFATCRHIAYNLTRKGPALTRKGSAEGFHPLRRKTAGWDMSISPPYRRVKSFTRFPCVQ
jgi:predicted transposase YbfD/YdcC